MEVNRFVGRMEVSGDPRHGFACYIGVSGERVHGFGRFDMQNLKTGVSQRIGVGISSGSVLRETYLEALGRAQMSTLMSWCGMAYCGRRTGGSCRSLSVVSDILQNKLI